jgi:hypothetical protein
MRRVVCFAALGLAACGQAPQRSDGSTSSPPAAPKVEYEARDSSSAPAARGARDAGPNVSPTAAPGVAFNYRYAFRLPSDRIAAVQERHAATCEALGVNRCRITGMLYRVVGENDVEAMLTFTLDPAIARRFGRAGVEAVTQAEGRLVESMITGEDVGSGIRQAGRDIAQLREELRRIEAQLARRDLPPEERPRLEEEARDLRARIEAASADRDDRQEMLATTPMTFNYGSGEFAPGEQRPSLRVALDRAIDGFLYGGTILLIVLITLLPWAVAGILRWWLFAAIRRRLLARRAAAPATANVATPPAT